MNTGTSIVEQATCLYLKEETGERVYDVRSGHRTVFTDLFQNPTAVTVDGEAVEYTARMWDNRNSPVCNSVVLEDCRGSEVKVTAKWVIPDDLKDLITRLDAVIAKGTDGRVKSKRIEDFQVTFNDNTEVGQFILDNGAILAKYSLCNVSQIRSGTVHRRRGWRGGVS